MSNLRRGRLKRLEEIRHMTQGMAPKTTKITILEAGDEGLTLTEMEIDQAALDAMDERDREIEERHRHALEREALDWMYSDD